MTNATKFLIDLGMESGMERPQNVTIGFENENVTQQPHDANIFDIMSVTECYCKIGIEFYPQDRMKVNYGTKNIMRLLKRLLILIKIIMDYLIILNHIQIIEQSKGVIEYMYLILDVKMIL